MHIHDGDVVWDANTIVAFDVTGANPDGSLNDSSEITGIRVYANAWDYFNDIPLYSYAPATPGDTIEIDDTIEGMGDQYLSLDASVMASSDAGAPVLGDMVLAAGIDLHTAVTTGGSLKLYETTDLDYNNDGTINTGTSEVGDGAFSVDNNFLTLICLARGTLIDTPMGLCPIEDLAEGDMVCTLDSGAQPIRWIGSRKTIGAGKHAPVRIRAGALGNPRDLYVSQNHRMLLPGAQAELLFGTNQVLVAAKYLVNDLTIRIEPCEEIEFFHFLFDEHQIVFAECCPTESLYPGREALDAVSPEARTEIISLFPEVIAAENAQRLARYELSRSEAMALSA